jgi:hypothetical protein
MPLEDHQFKKGTEPGPGRPKGARNKLSHAFVEAFAKDFEEHGADVIKIVRMEEPARYLQVAALLMPKAFDDEMPATVRIVTGVCRDGEIPLPGTTPSFRAPPVALPPPEPKAVALPLMTADSVAPLPRAADITKPEPAKAEVRTEVRKTEKLIYPKIVPRIGWR